MEDTLSRLRALLRQQASNSSNSTITPEIVLAELGVPSASIAMLNNDGTIQADCISSVGDDSETVFQACSISKPAAGMAAMRLVQQEKLRLDAKITEYLPESTLEVLSGGDFATPLTRALAAEITVAQLMSHTAGLTVSGFPGYPANLEDQSIPNPEVVLTGNAPVNTGRVRIRGFPSYAHAYSGGGITVLQLILEHVCGKSFPELMQELVLDPLEMKHSFYGRPKTGVNHANAYWTGYTKCDPPYNIFPEQAAAGLWTTPSDLVRMTKGLQLALAGKGIRDGDQPFITKELAHRMLQEVSNGMALTWRAPRDPGNSFNHSGNNFPGWNCFVMGYADVSGQGAVKPAQQNCAISVMTNSNMGWPVVQKLLRAAQYLNGWNSVEAVGSHSMYTAQTAFVDPEATIGTSWKDWIGLWGKERQFELVSGEENGESPHLKFKTYPTARLRPAAQPSLAHTENNGLWLVVEGLFLMLYLTTKDGKKVIEIWNEGAGSVDVLEKTL